MIGTESPENVVPVSDADIEAANSALAIVVSTSNVGDAMRYLTSAGRLCQQLGVSPKELRKLAGGIQPALLLDGIVWFDDLACRSISANRSRLSAPVQRQATDAEQRYYATEQINSENAAKAHAARG